MLIILTLMSLFLIGCGDNMVKGPHLEIPVESEPINIDDATFQFTDEMKEYMKAEDFQHLAVATSLCHT